MHFVFLENSNDFTSSSLNLKAIDSFQRALIHFCKELVNRGHSVSVFNSTSINKSEDGIDWINFSEISNFSDNPDIFIICNDTDFLDITINAKLKLFRYFSIKLLGSSFNLILLSIQIKYSYSFKKLKGKILKILAFNLF